MTENDKDKDGVAAPDAIGNDGDKIKADRRRKLVGITALLVVAAVGITVTALLFPYIVRLTNEADRLVFEEKIKSFGAGGAAVMLLIQIAQVVFAVIPGEPVELIMGVLYGSAGGFFMCLAGIAAGTSLIYLGVSAFGKKFAGLFVDTDKFRVFQFIKRKKSRRDMIFFFLFFIPGTPKDILTYFAPFADMPLPKLLALSLVARIPSVLSSTYVGDNLIAGNFTVSAIVYGAVGLVSVAGILLYNKFIAGENKALDKSTENNGSGDGD